MDLLALIFFALCFGAALRVVRPDSRDAVLDVIDGVKQASLVLVRWFLPLAPYAALVLAAWIAANLSFDAVQGLAAFALVVLLGLGFHFFVTYAVILNVFTGLNPAAFYERIAAVPLFAVATSSSLATLPVAIETSETDLGVSKDLGGLVLPLGAAVNVDGTALYQTVALLFVAQLSGVELSLGTLLATLLTLMLFSLVAGRVPGGSLITLMIVADAVGIGQESQAGLALLLGVDRVLAK